MTEDGDARRTSASCTAAVADRRHLPAVGIDTSEWDDPDYELLAFRGRDCDVRSRARRSTGPRRPARRPRRRGRAAGSRALREDVEDLVEPVAEITRFDECMYTVGLQQRRGYLFRDRRGASPPRRAVVRPARPAAARDSVMATSGEEPPQIECNEDAASGRTTTEADALVLVRSGVVRGHPAVVVGETDGAQPGRHPELGQDRVHLGVHDRRVTGRSGPRDVVRDLARPSAGRAPTPRRR